MSQLIISGILLLVIHFICRFGLRQVDYNFRLGCVIMALSMFLWVCLPAFGVPNRMMFVPALLMLNVWIYILFMCLHGTFLEDKAKAQNNLLDIGYWIAGTALLVVLLDQAERSLHGTIIFLGMLSIVSYLYYILLLVRWFYRAQHNRFHVHANGMMFLFSISALSILLLLQVVHSKLPLPLTYGLLFCGAVTYLMALMVVIYHRLAAHRQHLLAPWSSESVLGYGALSLLGTCLIQSTLFPIWIITCIWWLIIIMMFITEMSLVWNDLLTINHKGFYHMMVLRPYQAWLRIFSLSVLYHFAFLYQTLDNNHDWLVSMILRYGYYFITILVVLELVRVITTFGRK